MDSFSLIKTIHIVSASVLFGTGFGTAFFMLRAHLSGNREAMAVTMRNVVLADWIFTTPAVIIQPLTGLWLVFKLSIPLDSAWFVSVVFLYVLIGLCWIPVVAIQIKICRILGGGGGTHEYGTLMKVWIALGIPAFSMVLILFFLMVTKAGIGTSIGADLGLNQSSNSISKGMSSSCTLEIPWRTNSSSHRGSFRIGSKNGVSLIPDISWPFCSNRDNASNASSISPLQA